MSLISEAEQLLEEAEDLLLNNRGIPPEDRKEIALLTFKIKDLLKELGVK